MAGPQQERGPRRGPSVGLLCWEHDGRLLGPSLLPSPSAAASSSGPHAPPRSTYSPPPSPLTPAGRTDGGTPGRSAGAGRTAGVGHGAEGQTSDGFLGGQHGRPCPSTRAADFLGTRRHVRSGPWAASGPKAVIWSWTRCLRRTSQVRSPRCARPDPARSLLLTGVTALFRPQAGLGCLRPAGRPVRVTQGQTRPQRPCPLGIWLLLPSPSPSPRPPLRVLSVDATGCGAARQEAP